MILHDLRYRTKRYAACLLVIITAVVSVAAHRPNSAPAFVDITWASITNIYYEIGAVGVLTDGYLSCVPQDNFFGGGSGVAHTRAPFVPDTAIVRRVLDAIGGPKRVQLLLSGHSHFDHSLDTPTWARLTGASIIGPRTTCLQAQAFGLRADRCAPVVGGERLKIAEGVMMRVVRWNHGGDPAATPEQHNPVELSRVPTRDPATGGVRVGVAEDYPNGGGSRAFLFTVDAPGGRFSWFFQNTASAVDLAEPIVVDGINYGAPIDNLRAAMKDAGLESVDLWIGTGNPAVAAIVLPVLRPKAFLPIHWDGLYGAFAAGVPAPYADSAFEAVLRDAGVQLVRPTQYMDKWRLDHTGVRPVSNIAVKRALGFDR